LPEHKRPSLEKCALVAAKLDLSKETCQN